MTLDLATNGSVAEVRKHVKVLEETLNPGSAERLLARQRERSFVRIAQCENGMTRIGVLLDSVRATTVVRRDRRDGCGYSAGASVRRCPGSG